MHLSKPIKLYRTKNKTNKAIFKNDLGSGDLRMEWIMWPRKLTVVQMNEDGTNLTRN